MKRLVTTALIKTLRLINHLPLDTQIWVGKLLGLLLYRVSKKRRNVAKVNINLCFPNLDIDARDNLVRDTFIDNGIGVIETGMAWWSNPESFRERTHFEGLEHLEDALSQGRGAIILGAHYSTLDLGGLLFSLFHPLSAMYRPHNNPVIERVMKKGRLRCIDQLIDRRDFRTVLRQLKDNRVIWYAPDQDFGPQSSVFAPFFGVKAATVTATARLAKISRAPVMLLSHHRTEDNRYVLRLHPPLAPFPLTTEEESAHAVNRALEQGISYAPSQYMWVHRRFKSVPEIAKLYRQ